MVAGKPYEHQTDSWSLVVLTYELLIGSTPFHCINQMEMYKRIELADYHFPPIPLVFKNAKLFISGLLKRNPSDRMSLEDASNTLRLDAPIENKWTAFCCGALTSAFTVTLR